MNTKKKKKKKNTRTPGNRHVLFMSAEYFW